MIWFLSLFSHGNELVSELQWKFVHFFFFFFSEHVSQPIPHFYHLRTGFVWLLGISFQLVSMLPCCSLRRRTEMKTKAGIICCIVLQILTQYLKTRDFLTGHIKYSCNPHVFFSSADQFRIFMGGYHVLIKVLGGKELFCQNTTVKSSLFLIVGLQQNLLLIQIPKYELIFT